MEIKATDSKSGRSLTVEYDQIGADLKEAVEIHGSKIVYDLFKAKAIITIQDVMRRLLKTDKSDEEITKMATEFKLGTAAPRVALPPKAKAEAAIAAMSDEEKAAFIAELKAKLGM